MKRTRWTGPVGAAAGLLLAATWALGARAAQKPIDWAAPNPAFAGATFVKDPETCRTCHEESMRAYQETTHGQALRRAAPAETGECESCHGPRSKHVENPTDELAYGKLDAREQSLICLQCHDSGQRFGWKAGSHAANDVSCASCHRVMKAQSETALLAQRSVADTCYRCHADVRADMNKTSHHPVREGRLTCASCHNPHGASEGLLAKRTLNETCVSCHTEKRGPFLWEHAPVRESCASCHAAHGSNHRNLLTTKDSFLCLSCHSYGGHINLPRYNRVSNPYGLGCVNCHLAVHGSNHPSGAKLTR